MKKITFIGLGVMGFPMAGHLSKQGHKISVFTIDQKKNQNCGLKNIMEIILAQ